MTVLDLKQLLYDKYKILPSEQRLTIKLLKRAIITLTDSFPLSFFYIKHESIVYLERLITINKNQEIKNKILSKKSLKLKYLADIGFYDDASTRKKKKQSSSFSGKLPLDIISESPNEYNEEQLINGKNKTDYLISYIKTNKFSNFKEIIEHHKIKSLTELGSIGINSLHCAASNGCVEILNYIVNTLKDDVNTKTDQGWTALHFATIKEHYQCVQLLLEKNDIDVNVQLPDSGYTALHLGCKCNNVKVVGLLLYKSDYKIVDRYGKKANEYAKNENIQFLFQKREEMQKENENISEEDDSEVVYLKDNVDPLGLNTVSNEDIDKREKVDNNDKEEEYVFLKELTDIPKPPPKVSGNVEKSGRKLPIYRERHMELDPFEGLLKRYKTVDDYPNKPNEVLPLINISNCVVTYPVYSEGTIFNFEFTANGDSKEYYRVHSLAACNEWVQRINEAVDYSKYWDSVSKKYSNVKNYLQKMKPSKLVIDIDKPLIKHQSPSKTKHSTMTEHKTSPTSNTRKHIKQTNKGIIASTSKIQREATLLEDSQISKGIGFNSFQILEILGTGAFGKVFKVRLITNKQIYTMKVLDKKYLIRNNILRYAITQCNILRQINNPFVIKLHFSFQTADFLYMVLDYCPGGDLAYHVNMNLVDEHDAKLYSAEIIYALLDLHKNGIVFRNLRLENVMISTDGHIKLADLSLVKENVKEGNKELNEKMWIYEYENDEMKTRKGKGRSEDLFNVGMLIHEMLTGTKPLFIKDGKNEGKLGKVMLCQFLSGNVKDLLKSLLNNNPEERLGINNENSIQRHKFFDEIRWDRLERKKGHPHFNLFEIKRNNNKKYITVIHKNSQFEEGHSKLSHIFSFNRPQSPSMNTK